MPGPAMARNSNSRRRQKRVRLPHSEARARQGSTHPGMSFHRVTGVEFSIACFSAARFSSSRFPNTATFSTFRTNQRLKLDC